VGKRPLKEGEICCGVRFFNGGGENELTAKTNSKGGAGAFSVPYTYNPTWQPGFRGRKGRGKNEAPFKGKQFA